MYIFKNIFHRNILLPMLLLGVIGTVVVCGGMGSPRPQWEKENAVLQSELKAEKSRNEVLSSEAEAAKNKTDTLYFCLIVAVILGVVGIFAATILSSDTRRKFQQMKRDKEKGGGDEQESETG